MRKILGMQEKPKGWLEIIMATHGNCFFKKRILDLILLCIKGLQTFYSCLLVMTFKKMFRVYKILCCLYNLSQKSTTWSDWFSGGYSYALFFLHTGSRTPSCHASTSINVRVRYIKWHCICIEPTHVFLCAVNHF